VQKKNPVHTFLGNSNPEIKRLILVLYSFENHKLYIKHLNYLKVDIIYNIYQLIINFDHNNIGTYIYTYFIASMKKFNKIMRKMFWGHGPCPPPKSLHC